MKPIYALALIPLVASQPAMAQVRWFNELPSAAVPSRSNSILLCQNSLGCGSATDLTQAPLAQVLSNANMPPVVPHYVTGNYTLAASDIGIPVCLKGSTAAATLTVPAAGGAGFTAGAEYIICDDDTNTLTIAPASGTIDGPLSDTLSQGQWMILDSEGTNWQGFANGGGTALTAPVLGVGP